ncbi:MAG: GtrA family protein [Bacteroidetes bacterium]|nr:GtrA family protein [Bacteroidota bacterium]MBS1540875.1 GtrA family protein [Bacteroidota bacterium]
MEINEAFIFKFLKFGLVGISGMAVDFGITYLIKEKIKANKYVANTLGFFCAATSNFLFNRLWTFESSDPAVVFQYAKFLTISIVGVMLSNAIIYLLHEKWKWNFYVAKLVSIGIVLFWNFFANYFFTFNG